MATKKQIEMWMRVNVDEYCGGTGMPLFYTGLHSDEAYKNIINAFNFMSDFIDYHYTHLIECFRVSLDERIIRNPGTNEIAIKFIRYYTCRASNEKLIKQFTADVKHVWSICKKRKNSSSCIKKYDDTINLLVDILNGHAVDCEETKRKYPEKWLKNMIGVKANPVQAMAVDAFLSEIRRLEDERCGARDAIAQNFEQEKIKFLEDLKERKALALKEFDLQHKQKIADIYAQIKQCEVA